MATLVGGGATVSFALLLLVLCVGGCDAAVPFCSRTLDFSPELGTFFVGVGKLSAVALTLVAGCVGVGVIGTACLREASKVAWRDATKAVRAACTLGPCKVHHTRDERYGKKIVMGSHSGEDGRVIIRSGYIRGRGSFRGRTLSDSGPVPLDSHTFMSREKETEMERARSETRGAFILQARLQACSLEHTNLLNSYNWS